MTEILLIVTKVALLTFLLTSMFAMGLSLTVRQIITPLKNARLVSLALAANFIVVPLFAVSLGRLLRLDEPFALGLLLLGLASGAPFLPKMAQIANGNLAFAVGLMVLLVIGTVVYLPCVLPLVGKGVQISPWKIAQSLVWLMLLPLFAGLAVKSRFDSVAAQLRPVLAPLSNLSLLVMIVLIVALNFSSVLSVFGSRAILAGILFTISSALTGWFLAGRDDDTRKVLGLGTGFRNISAALVVSVQNFKDPNVSVMLVTGALTGLFLLLPAAWILGKRTEMNCSLENINP
jgi:BASS family bile acid:Na+ symporter